MISDESAETKLVDKRIQDLTKCITDRIIRLSQKPEDQRLTAEFKKRRISTCDNTMSDIEIIICILSSTTKTKLCKNRNRLHKPRNHAQAKKTSPHQPARKSYYLYVGIGCDAMRHPLIMGRHPRKRTPQEEGGRRGTDQIAGAEQFALRRQQRAARRGR